MELTCGLLYELLKEKLPVSQPDQAQAGCRIRNILPETAEGRKADVLYIAMRPEPPEGGMILWLTEIPSDRWHVCCRQEEQWSVFSCILETFQTFLLWKEKGIILTEQQRDLNLLLAHGAELLYTEARIYNRDYSVDAGYFLKNSMLETETAEKGGGTRQELLLNEEVQELYRADPQFDQTFQTRGLSFWNSAVSLPEDCVYYYNFFHERLYLGRLVLVFPKQKASKAMLQLMEGFCEQVEACYLYHYLRRYETEPTGILERIWERLLSREPVDTRETAACLAARNWKTEDRYQIFCLSPIHFHSDQTLEYYLICLKQDFPDILVVVLEGRVYGLRNLSREPESGFQQKLAGFLRENLFKAGISCIFENFMDAYRYRCQAEDALSLGNEADPSIWRYDFSAYSFAYIRRQCLQQYAGRDLCPRNLRTLIEYDSTHPDSRLVPTLYQYYICRFNGQLAAERLFIHRTTFFYRMNKIRKIASFHPEDPEETCQILLAFQLLGKSDLNES